MNAGSTLPPQCGPSGRRGCLPSVDGKEVLWLTGEIALEVHLAWSAGP